MSRSFYHVLLLAMFLVRLSTAQQIEPKFTGTISYDELVKRKIQRVVEWTNPNGIKEELTFIEMTIPTNDAMIKLTVNFNTDNYGLTTPWLDPRMIVFHSMDLGDLQESLEQASFLHDQMPANWGNLPKAGKLPNGAHFMVDQDGTVFCLAPPLDQTGQVSYKADDHHWYIKRHADGNPVAIGIENATSRNGDLTDLTVAQVESNARLARWLISMEAGRIDHLASHHQLSEVKFLEKMLGFYHLHYYGMKYRTTGRSDVGDEKFSEIKSKVYDFGFKIPADFD